MNYEFLRDGEGLRLEPYLDTKGVPTIGYGTTMYPSGKKVTLQDPGITIDQAEEFMKWAVETKWNAVKGKIIPQLNDNQKAAIVSLVYNIGVAGFNGSTLLKRINTGYTKQGIVEAFMMWDKETINGKKVFNQGLANRRKKEADLYFS